MAKGDPRTGGGSGYFPAIYQSAIAQSAGDYDSIMNQYKSLGEKATSAPSSAGNFGEKVNYSSIAPNFTDLAAGSNYDYVRDFVNTGGYSDADVGNLRERAISPIRSIYDSANRNLLRQKNLSGGYAPNMAAAQAKMARESSNLISSRTTDANAAIAEMQQKGKLAGAQMLAPLEAAETARRQSVMDANTNIANQANIFNANRELDVARHNTEVGRSNAALQDNDFSKILSTIQGQSNLFGTSPGMLGTIGSQTMQAANLANNLPPVQQGSMSGSTAVTGASNPNVWRLPTWSAGVSYPSMRG